MHQKMSRRTYINLQTVVIFTQGLWVIFSSFYFSVFQFSVKHMFKKKEKWTFSRKQPLMTFTSPVFPGSVPPRPKPGSVSACGLDRIEGKSLALFPQVRISSEGWHPASNMCLLFNCRSQSRTQHIGVLRFFSPSLSIIPMRSKMKSGIRLALGEEGG